VNGVGSPMCIYCPQPEYSDEARKAKYQGTVLLDVTVTADGRVLNPQVLKGPVSARRKSHGASEELEDAPGRSPAASR